MFLLPSPSCQKLLKGRTNFNSIGEDTNFFAKLGKFLKFKPPGQTSLEVLELNDLKRIILIGLSVRES